MERKTLVVPVTALRDFMERLLLAVGCDHASAVIAADVFLEADMRGVGLQGLDHMHSLIRGIRNGHIDPTGIPHLKSEGMAFVLIDGHRGPGQRAATMAVDLIVKKALAAGSCSAAIINSSDIFMLSYYAECIARAGLVGFVFTSTAPLVHPYGGIDKILGTNPLAISFPTADAFPVVIDMATSALSASRVRHAAYFGEEVPEGGGVDEHGRPTRNPRLMRPGGAIGPLAGHKGFALGLAVAVLSGPLVGANTGLGLQSWQTDEQGPQGAWGHFMFAIDPAAFGDSQAFRAAVSNYLAQIRNSRKTNGVNEIRIPGWRSLKTRERSLREGVTLYEVVWSRALDLAKVLNVEAPRL